MKKKTLSFSVIAALILVFCSLSGCRQKIDLKIGYIDTDQLLVRCEKYKKVGEDFQKDQEALVKKYAGPDGQKPSLEGQVEVLKLQEKWDRIKKDVRDEIRTATMEIAREKKLDLVLDNTTSNPVIEYGGVNITDDIVKRLK